MEEKTHQRVVGISISTPPNLAQLGFGEEHMHELMIAIARTLLRLGEPGKPVHLAYGGDLRPGGFTETMLDLSRAESVIARNDADTTVQDARKRRHGRIYSYLAWPYYADLTRSYEAQHLNVCSFIRVTPRDADLDENKYPDTIGQSELSGDDLLFLKARCISCLRELMNRGGGRTVSGHSPPLAARVILGGKTSHYSGVMPGIFEEFMLAQEAGIPVYLVGGFGGAAKALADAALQESTETLPVFTLEGQLSDKRNTDLGDLVRIYEDKRDEASLNSRYRRLEKMIDSYRIDLGRPKSETGTNGLSRADNERLMYAQNIAQITGLIECGLRNRWQSGK